MKRWMLLLRALLLSARPLAGCGGGMDDQAAEKPVIYLYPEEETLTTVELTLDGTLTASYPAYGTGWQVLAHPDGTLTDSTTGRTYYCLFWEGTSRADYDMTEGFVVPGADTAAFLEETLARLGLTEREAEEFIIYWLPRMEGNAYNLISFQGETYTQSARLHVSPEPDTVIRVFMVWQALEEPVEISPQELAETPPREGFTLVEWGGTELS